MTVERTPASHPATFFASWHQTLSRKPLFRSSINQLFVLQDVATVWQRVRAAAVVHDSTEGQALSPIRSRSAIPNRSRSVSPSKSQPASPNKSQSASPSKIQSLSPSSATKTLSGLVAQTLSGVPSGGVAESDSRSISPNKGFQEGGASFHVVVEVGHFSPACQHGCLLYVTSLQRHQTCHVHCTAEAC